jgi:unsaturated rhamnogalacturonyl hydrolase
VGSNGAIATYREADYNIDMIVPGRVVLECYEETHEERLKIAAATLRGQLAKHPRTSDGGFWHKQRYPWQMWLDGLYMGSPFLAHYGKVFNEPAAFDEVVKQIQLMDQHAYDPVTGLYFHGWDEKRAQSWADPETGRSPCFWGRAIGWYAMALVDCMDHLPSDHRGVESVKAVLRRLADGVVRYQDPKTGLWWQVVDQGGREGNYLESSASSMFVYALAKGINRGYLPREKFQPAVLKGYEGLVRDFIRTDGDGRIHLTRTCEVAGLGFTASNGRPRDGSFGYYISEPVVENDLKGVGPFILAGIEVQRMVSKSPISTP